MNLSTRSEKRLEGVHPDLVRVVRNALSALPFDVQVLEGVRTIERQRELFAQGRTKPGKIVTWSMSSRHLTGHAVDLVPMRADGRVNWDDKALFFKIGDAMFAAAKAEDVPIRWGYDWDGDGVRMEKGEYDGPHFELSRGKYP